MNDTTRYILLGASNLTIGFPLLVENLRSAGDCDIFAAGGFGRSYGSRSRFLFRALPGIVECGLWDAVAEVGDAAPIRALVTDIGNDLPYGYSPDQITGWVAVCLDRLRWMKAEIIVTLPPVESVQHLSRWRYRLIRRFFFPNCRIPFDGMRDSAVELHASIAELAKNNADHVVSLPGDWYGFDPIHIRRRQRPVAWRTILSHWSEFDFPDPFRAASSTIKRLVKRSREQVREVRGVEQRHEQPAIRLDGLTVSLF